MIIWTWSVADCFERSSIRSLVSIVRGEDIEKRSTPGNSIPLWKSIPNLRAISVFDFAVRVDITESSTVLLDLFGRHCSFVEINSMEQWVFRSEPAISRCFLYDELRITADDFSSRHAFAIEIIIYCIFLLDVIVIFGNQCFVRDTCWRIFIVAFENFGWIGHLFGSVVCLGSSMFFYILSMACTERKLYGNNLSSWFLLSVPV